jgi:hypothetical protein
MSEPTYLGDGLYAELDPGQMIILRTPRDDGGRWVEHWVGLEPEVFLELLRFARRNGFGDLIDREHGEQP